MNCILRIFRKKEISPIRLTLKAIIRWEQLNNKPFSQLNNISDDEVLSLFYVCTLYDEVKTTFEEFKANLKPNQAQRISKELERQTHINSQFQPLANKKETKIKNTVQKNATQKDTYIKDTVAMLVMNGLDIDYVMNEMELHDLPLFLQAYDQKIKDTLTAQRLWAFMQLLPHLDKGTTPQDIHPFAWELAEETLSEEELEQSLEQSVTFLRTGLKK